MKLSIVIQTLNSKNKLFAILSNLEYLFLFQTYKSQNWMQTLSEQQVPVNFVKQWTIFLIHFEAFRKETMNTHKNLLKPSLEGNLSNFWVKMTFLPKTVSKQSCQKHPSRFVVQFYDSTNVKSTIYMDCFPKTSDVSK